MAPAVLYNKTRRGDRQGEKSVKGKKGVKMARVEIRVPDWLDRIFAWPVVMYRRQKYDLAFRKISLGDCYFTIVSPEDYYRLNVSHWSARKNSGSIYAVRFAKECENGPEIVAMHRVIMKHPKGLLVDHKSCNTLDNTRSNLRPATRSQNLANRRKNKAAATSRFIGVCKKKGRKKWDAYIGYGGKVRWIGAYEDEIEAARAYDAAAKKYHGQFARLNFPQPGEVRQAEQLRRITHGKSEHTT